VTIALPPAVDEQVVHRVVEIRAERDPQD